MARQVLWLGLLGLALQCGCTSDPTAPVNQVFPVPQLDRAFGDPHPQYYSRTETPDYTKRPGYLPAYPPYENYRPYPPGMQGAAESSATSGDPDL